MNEPESTNEDYLQAPKEMFGGGGQRNQSKVQSQIQTPTLAQSIEGDAQGTAQ